MGTASKHGENETFLSLCRRGGGIFLSFFYSSEPGMTQKLTRSRVFFCSLHEPHAASFSRDVILVPILRLFLFGLFFFFSFLLLETSRPIFQVVTLQHSCRTTANEKESVTFEITIIIIIII